MITLDISPTTFNFLSDLLGLCGNIFLHQTIHYAYPMLMSIHVRRGKYIPFEKLGAISTDYLALFTSAYRDKQYRSPITYLFVILILVASFSHPFSDLLLDFTTVNISSGNRETVLDLSRRNNNFLYQIVGDPYNARTIPFLISEEAIQNNEVVAESKAAEIADRFMSSIDSIAQGISPFQKSKYKYDEGEGAYFGNTFVTYVESQGNEPIARIRGNIPLNCTDAVMVRVDQFSSFWIPTYRYNDQFENMALLPNCTFDTERESGIYGRKAEGDVVTITDYVSKFESSLGTVGPIINGNVATEFRMPKGARLLARDRDDWKKGRKVTGITGFQVGTQLIELNSTAFSRIGDALEPALIDGTWQRQSEYIFISGIEDGKCPPKPTASLMTPPNATEDGDNCLLTFTAYCDPFLEDSIPIPPLLDDVSDTLPEWAECETYDVTVLWGKNLDLDEQFLAAVAGIYSRNKPLVARSTGGFGQSEVMWNGVLAAKFALGSVTTMTSTEKVVRAKIGAGWFLLIMLPFIVGGVLLIVAKSYDNCCCAENNAQLAIPRDVWELMIVGREEDEIVPIRDNITEPFQRRPKNLKYGFVNDLELRLISDSKARSSQISSPIKQSQASNQDNSSVAQAVEVVYDLEKKSVDSPSSDEEDAGSPKSGKSLKEDDAGSPLVGKGGGISYFDEIGKEIKIMEVPKGKKDIDDNV